MCIRRITTNMNTLPDIFEAGIMCKNCHKEMEKGFISKEGFKIRILKCPICKSHYYHPGDIKDFEQYQKLKEKEYNVKLRMVGNSFCVSIPRDIINSQQLEVNSTVAVVVNEPGKITLIYKKKVYK